MAYGLLSENWRMRLIMTKSEIEELIQELELSASESLLEATEKEEEDSSGGGEYEFGVADGISYCIEILKGRAGYYD